MPTQEIDWRKGAPRWLLLWGLLISVALGTTCGSALFNLIMLREAEIKSAQVAPALQGIADLDVRMNRLEIRMAAVEVRLPEMSQKLDKIDQNVDRLLRRR